MSREDLNTIRNVIVQDEEGTVIERFNFGCKGIRSLKGLMQGLWSLNPFSEALSGMNGFADVDGHCEIDGRGLALEFKKSFKGMTKGQMMKAIRQAKFQKTCTWFIEGDTDNPKRIFCINETGVEGSLRVTTIEDTDLEKLQARIKLWEQWAKKNSLVKGNKTEEWNLVSEMFKMCRQG